MCSICGQPGFIRCNCQSAQPFCDQCQNDSVCKDIVDSECVVYHFQTPTYTPPATRLINLNLPNGSSAQTIFEAIDAALGFARPWVPGDTNTVHLFTSGFGFPVTLKGDVKISAASGNTISANSDGLFVPGSIYSGKVRVDATSPLRYLADSIVGGTDGCVTISVVDQSGLLAIIPTLDPLCLADLICSSDITVKEQFGACIVGEGTEVADTPSIHMMKGGFPITISANAKISAASGNTLSILSDGLFASGGTSASADNGLSVSGGFIQLGGPLIKNTTLDFANLYQLNFVNTPKLNIGSSTALTNLSLSVTSSDPNNTFLSAFQNTQDISNANLCSLDSTLEITGGPFTQTALTNFLFAGAGQLWINNTGGDVVLNSSPYVAFYTGIYGTAIKSSSSNISGNILSGGFFAGYPADGGNISDMAAIRTEGALNPPPAFGGAFTGTITNYYGLHIGDIANSPHGSSVTNKYAIYQVGTTDASRFFGPVQNAGGSTQFTSDERVKENINLFKRGLSEIEKINPRTFNYTYNKAKVITGIIAQELENIIPESIEKGNFSTPDGQTNFTDFRMVDQNVLFYTMLNAIKDLSSLNKSLTDRITALENKNTVFGSNS